MSVDLIPWIILALVMFGPLALVAIGLHRQDVAWAREDEALRPDERERG